MELKKKELLTPAEVAELFRVDPKTVTRWAKAGRLHPVRTIGGHRRYKRAECEAWLSGVNTDSPLTWSKTGFED